MFALPANYEIAVLASHRFRSPPVREELDRRNLRHVMLGDPSLEGHPISQLIRLACAVLGAQAGSHSVALSDLSGILNDPSEETIATFTEAVERARRAPRRSLLPRFLETFNLVRDISAQGHAETAHLLDRMFKKAADDNPNADAAALASTVLIDWQRLEAHALRAEQAVHLMTSYAAKGLEYKIVVLPFLNENDVPRAPKGEQIDWKESRRLFYVAVTRASHRLIFTRDKGRPASHLTASLDRSEITLIGR